MRMFFWTVAGVMLMAGTVRGELVEPVRIDAGLVAGVSGKDAGVRVFKGIPYATPPVGPLRWRAPLPAKSWEGVLQADHFGAACVQPPYAAGSFYQLEFFTQAAPAMSEDCLYLNVWTGAKSATEKRAVMVWIHGGGGVQGYASEPCFDGEAFAEHGVVLVSFNYRLGILGHFAHAELSAESEHHVSGNYAELDQIAALQWVYRNIAAFGGDPNNVTVFGQSSGGASINRLLVCPLARGLFQKVIVESAGLLNSKDSKVKLPEMEERGAAFAKMVGAKSVAELRAMSAEEVLAASQKMKFDPNVDGFVLPELALNVFDRGRQMAVPMMIGSTSDEGSYGAVTREKFRGDMTKRFGAEAEAFFQLYPAGTDAEAMQAKHDERRDESAAGERREALAQARLRAPVYLYYFSRKPPGREREKYGAFHAAELEYVFNTQGATDRPWEKADRELAEKMIGFWTNFAKRGEPNGEGLAEWPRVDAEAGGPVEMEFGDVVGKRPIADTERLDFLEKILSVEAR